MPRSSFQVVMTLVSIPLMDRTGRRTLHLYGLGGMFIFSIFITISFLIKASYFQPLLFILRVISTVCSDRAAVAGCSSPPPQRQHPPGRHHRLSNLKRMSLDRASAAVRFPSPSSSSSVGDVWGCGGGWPDKIAENSMTCYFTTIGAPRFICSE